VNQFAVLRFPQERVAGGLEFPLPHNSIAVTVFSHIKAVGSLPQRVKGSRWSVDFIIKAAANGQTGQAQEDTHLDEVLTHGEDLDIGLLGESQNRTVVKFDLGPAVRTCIDPVSGLKGDVDRCGGPLHVGCMLNADMSVEVREAGDAKVLIRVRPRHRAGQDDDCR
jgi:hypothetical protein